MLPEKTRFLVIIFFLLYSVGIFAGPIYLQVNNSHDGKITDIVYDSTGKYLFSSGVDGSVRVWDVAHSVLLKSLRGSYLPIKMLAVSFDGSKVAALYSNEISIFRLYVWNWRDNKLLFKRDFETMPLYMNFSSRGSYFVYTLPNWKSVRVLNAFSGSEIGVFDKSFGIVSFFVFSKSENNIMTYQPSGVITYWNFRTGRELKKIYTLSNLAKITISHNRRFLIAKRGNGIVMVDLLSGDLLDTADVFGVESISISQGDNEVACISFKDGVRRIDRFMLLNNGFLKIEEEEDSDISILEYGNNGLFKGYLNGEIREWVPGSVSDKVIGRDKIKHISDFLIDNLGLIIVSQDSMILIDSNYFNSGVGLDGNSDIYLKIKEFPNPIGIASKIERLDTDRLVLWGIKSREGFVVFNTTTGTVDFRDNDFDSPIVYLGVSSEYIVAIEDSGKCKLYDRNTFEVKYSYFIPGIHKLISIDEKGMVGAKSKISDFDSSLTLLNTETGENYPINDSSLYVYELIYDRRDSLLYTIGIEKRGPSLFTVLKSHSGSDFAFQNILDEFEGEDIGASLTLDSDSRTLFSSVGYGNLKGYSGRDVIKFKGSSALPRKILYYNGRVYSLNRNKTFTVWDVRKREAALNFYLLSDNRWIAVLEQYGINPKGFYASNGVDNLINVIKDGYILNGYRDFYKRHLTDSFEDYGSGMIPNRSSNF